MAEDTRKEAEDVESGGGVLLFPREWEGLSDAFPELPPAMDTRNPLTPSLSHLVYGASAGVLWNMTQAFRRKPLSRAVLNGIGFVSVPLTMWKVVMEERNRRAVMPDIQAILKADGVDLPKRQWAKYVKGPAPDGMQLICGQFAMLGLLIYRRAPNALPTNYLSWFGAFTIGQFVGLQIHERTGLSGSDVKPGNLHAALKYKADIARASQIWTTRTMKPPHPYLYGEFFHLSGPASSPDHRSVMSAHAHAGAVASSVDGHAEGLSDILAAEAEPNGSAPHVSYVDHEGKTQSIAQRDFDWNPETKELAIETLQDHLEDLKQSRQVAVQSAQYLWEVIARREAEAYKPFGRKAESQGVILEKKALELLSSLHKQHYAQIADLDWCIANTQKLILQAQTDGAWLPQKASIADLAKVREKVLHNVRAHRKNLEVQNSTMDDSLKMMVALPDEEKEEIKKAVAENLQATLKLLEDLESGRDV